MAMRGESAGYIGDIPGHYDRGMGPVLFADYADDLARRVAARSPRRVLEIAAGTGILTQRLRDLLPGAARLVATDLNPPMLDTAKPKFAADEAIEFQQADALSLPFGDGAFDVVVCQFGVMFFPDKPASYKEVHRVLAPGGSYVFNVWDAHRHNPAYHIAQELVTAQFPSDPPGFFEVPFAYHAIDPVKDALGDAGFTDLPYSGAEPDQGGGRYRTVHARRCVWEPDDRSNRCSRRRSRRDRRRSRCGVPQGVWKRTEPHSAAGQRLRGHAPVTGAWGSEMIELPRQAG